MSMLRFENHPSSPDSDGNGERTTDRPIRGPSEMERRVQRLTSLLEALPAAFVELDGNGVIQECNPAARELLGEPLQGALWRVVVGRAFAPRDDDGHEVSLHDGRRVHVATCSLGSAPGQLLLINDVTEMRRLQEQLSHLKRLSAMGEMAASLAHQIRTPLASALLYASHLGCEHLDATARRRFSQRLTDRLGHLESLVRDMLVFARNGVCRRDELPLRGLHADFVHAVETQIEAAGVALRTSYIGGEARVNVNREALLGALQNLVTNAMQAGSSRIELQCIADGGDAARIVVSDDGSGIPSAIQERLFEPFFTTRADGTGLGLAVVQAVVGAHGGSVTVRSAPGAGSSFVVALPVLSGNQASGCLEAGEAPEALETSGAPGPSGAPEARARASQGSPG